MADPPSSPAATADHNSSKPESDNPELLPNQPDPTSNSATPPPPPSPLTQQQTPNPNPTPNPYPALVSTPAHAFPSYAPPISGASVPPLAQSFRPIPQFSPLPNYQNPSVGVQPPGVSAPSVMASGAPGAVPVPTPVMQYQVPPGQHPNPALRPYAPLPNGYGVIPGAVPQGTMQPPGIQRYPSPYQAMVRPMFPPRPPGVIGMLPAGSRPLVPGIPAVRPIIPPIIRPAVPSVTPAEKPQTTVYVGKIEPTVENDFMLSLLRLCGPVKSWKRAQDPSDGTPKRFGFCEFESAEGVLRALRLLSKFNIDGQELVLNVNQATREYLERYVEKKTENSKNLKENQAAKIDKEDGTALGVEKNEPSKSSEEDSNIDKEKGDKESHDLANFGIVTDEDKEADKEALEKLTSMIEERLKTKPLPPPPPQTPADASGNTNSELPAKSRDGDSDADIVRPDTAEDKNDDETSDNKAASEQDRPETSSPDRSRKYDRRSRERDRDRDLKREKERELERYEREAERERIRKEREQRRKIEEAEREFEERLKDWEYREREKEKQRQYEKEKEKERERKRRKEILYDEEGDDDDSRKRWHRSILEEKRRKRLREKEEDMADRLKEGEEIAEAKSRAEEERLQQQQGDALKLSSDLIMNGSEKKILVEEAIIESKDKFVEQVNEGDSGNENRADDEVLQNGAADESTLTPMTESDMRRSGNVPARKLGFGLVGSGKRATVPSVFHEEDDDEAHKDKKMRPLVPIDYSTEELQAVQPAVTGAQPPNLAAAAEFAKRISNATPKEERPDVERERSRRSHDRSIQRDRDRNDEDINRMRDEKDKILEQDRNREHGLDKVKTPDKQKLLDAKQLIDMIPKTKDELFSYEINWAVYDKHGLHERMRPWISKKITEFLGEEETTLVDYIVSSTQEHVKASQMLDMLQSILDDEAEMFVLKMWRMLIFEIKKVETGLALRSKS